MSNNNEDILNIFSKSKPTPKKVESMPASDSKVYTLQYGTEQVTLPFKEGLTVAQAFKQAAHELGFDPNRMVAYRSQGETLQPTAEIRAFQTFAASTTAESKGSLLAA